MDLLVVAIIVMAVSMSLSGLAGHKNSYKLYALSLLIFLLGSGIMYIGVKAKAAIYTDDCAKAGGTYVLDEKVQLKGDTAMDLYKCVK